jgi:hypothetical protein
MRLSIVSRSTMTPRRQVTTRLSMLVHFQACHAHFSATYARDRRGSDPVTHNIHNSFRLRCSFKLGCQIAGAARSGRYCTSQKATRTIVSSKPNVTGSSYRKVLAAVQDLRILKISIRAVRLTKAKYQLYQLLQQLYASAAIVYVAAARARFVTQATTQLNCLPACRCTWTRLRRICTVLF